MTGDVPRCPNPDCREVVAVGDQYCEGCGEPIRREQEAARHQGLEVELAPPAGRPNGAHPRPDRETRGPSRVRDHVEILLPSVAGVSDRGAERSRNEDAVRVGRAGSLATTLLVVCDGVSSTQSAARASQAAADAAITSLAAALDAGGQDVEKAMENAISAARAAVSSIVYQPQAAKDPPSTTLVAAAIGGGQVTVGWVGDSRAYFVTESGTWQLSRDDTWAADQVALGRLSEWEAAADPRGRFLTKWLGTDQATGAGPSVRTFEIEWPGLVLLCSDGLWNYLETADSLSEMVVELGDGASPEVIARTLTEFARAAGGHDNITVAVAALGVAEVMRPADQLVLDTGSGRAAQGAGQG